MREIRQSGSEGGGNEQTVSPYPYLKSSSKILTIVSFQHQRINIRCSIRKTGSDQTVAHASGSE